MAPPEDQIVDIPKERLKFFGGPGEMLLPGPATVAALIKRIPEHKLLTGKPSGWNVNLKRGQPLGRINC